MKKSTVKKETNKVIKIVNQCGLYRVMQALFEQVGEQELLAVIREIRFDKEDI